MKLAMKQIDFPVLQVKLVPIEKVVANDYNPNSVAPPEMKLLKLSIEEDGYTQPIVAYHDHENDQYIIIDGFHRYRCAKEYFKLPQVPIVVIDKPLSNRVASTIRHNRARGTHSVQGMSGIVLSLINDGWTDIDKAKHLGMDAEEVLKLKQATGLKQAFANHEFSNSWEEFESKIQNNYKDQL